MNCPTTAVALAVLFLLLPPSARATVTSTGANTLNYSGGNTAIGFNGPGTLVINNTPSTTTFTTGLDATVGWNSGSTAGSGEVDVTGVGALWTITGSGSFVSLNVGNAARER